jgi:AcrR family transcriptional regulator
MYIGYACQVSSTRERILESARGLIEAQPDAVLSMSDVARATGISRQALYLHFPDRATLLLAVADHVDEREDLAGEVAAVQTAPDGVAQTRAWVDMQARRNPRIAPFARALDQSRHGDDPTTAAWRNRTANRLRAATAIVQQLRREGHVHRSWTTTEAAIVVWELVSFRVWDDLVNEADLTPERYAEIVTTAALATLAAPVRRSPRAGTRDAPRGRGASR